MGPVPENFSLEKLLGRELNAICIGPFDLQFRFDSVHVISCTSGKVILEVDGKSTVVFAKEKHVDLSLFPLIAGGDVVAWKVEGSHEFSVTLSAGARLRFQSKDSSYEDFVIWPELQVV
jgi:hypothetical protein